MIEVRISDKNHVEAASGLRLARLHRAAELIGELDTGVRNAIIVIVTNKKGKNMICSTCLLFARAKKWQAQARKRASWGFSCFWSPSLNLNA